MVLHLGARAEMGTQVVTVKVCPSICPRPSYAMAYERRSNGPIAKVSKVPLLTPVAARVNVPFTELLVKNLHNLTSVAPFQLA